jgi:hypothetical protein
MESFEKQDIIYIFTQYICNFRNNLLAGVDSSSIFLRIILDSSL